MSDLARWRTGPLETVADYFTDGDWIETPFITDQGIRLIQTGNVGIGEYLDKPATRKYINEATFRSLGCKEVLPQDLLICRLADPVGRACVIPDHVGWAITAVDCTIVRLDESRVERAFLRHWMSTSSWLNACERVAAGTTRTRISRSNLGALEVPLPPIAEQRRIAEILDTIDESIQATERLIAKHANLSLGIQDHLLGTHDWRPQQSSNMAIGDLAVYVASGVTPTGGAAVYAKAGVLFVRSQNVHFDGLKLEDVAFIPQSIHESMIRSALEPWDVLYNITGASIGRCTVFPSELGPANVNQHVCAIRLPQRSRQDSTFLAAVLASDIGRRQLRSLNAGSNREGLNYKQLRSFQVPWPTAELRGQVATAVESSRAVIDSLTNERTLLRGVRAGLAGDLLSGHVRTDLT